MTTSTMTSERLIYTDLTANNNKFWHAELDGTVLKLEWGRVGDAIPQKKSYTYLDAEKAEKAFKSKVNSKLKKGYTKQHTLSGGVPAVAYVAKVQIQHND